MDGCKTRCNVRRDIAGPTQPGTLGPCPPGSCSSPMPPLSAALPENEHLQKGERNVRWKRIGKETRREGTNGKEKEETQHAESDIS